VVGLAVMVAVASAADARGATAGDHGGLGMDARAAPNGGAVDILGRWSDGQSERTPLTPVSSSSSIQHEDRFARACASGANERLVPGDVTCFGIGAPVCEENETPRLPRWTRTRVPPSETWSDWVMQDYGSCVGADAPVPVLTAEDFRRLPLPAPALHVQPDGDWVLVNIETIVYTDPTPVTLTTELLGQVVTVEATPTRFTYDWGDGHSTTTTDPGRPYPAFDVVHVYEQPGRVAITLTTQWSGRYRVGGDPQWRDVTGTAQTSVTGPTIDVEERTSRLVSGTCLQQPDAPGCEGFDPRSARR
jgi:hypothetical protein